MPRSGALRTWFVCACVVLAAYEVWTVFIRATPAVAIQGSHRVPIREFRDGTPVSQSFEMIGDGLDAIAVQFASDTPATLIVQCDLVETSAALESTGGERYGWSTTVKRVSGVEWRRLEFPRMPSSHRRTFTLRLKLLGAAAFDESTPLEMRNLRRDERPDVAVMGSTDNVFGGGSFWIDDRRQVGSLSLRAFTPRRTAYERYRADVAPALPPVLRSGAVAIILAVAYQWALLTVVYRLVAAALTAREPRATMRRPQAL